MLDRRWPLPPQLDRHKAVCDREGLPCHSKVDLAMAARAHLHPPSDTPTQVVGDSWYHGRRVRQAAVHRG